MPTRREGFFDPPAELAVTRARDPLHRLAYPDGSEGWIVTGHEMARTILGDQRFSARADLRRWPIERPGMASIYGQPPIPGYFLLMDPPEHSRYRRPIIRHFTVRRMAQLHVRVSEIVNAQLDHLEAVGCPADLVEHFALPVPARVICELFGVPDEHGAAFVRSANRLLSLQSSAEEGAEAYHAIIELLRGLIDEKRSGPATDLLADLARSTDLTTDELAVVAWLVLIGGHDTTAKMLALGTFALLTHQDQLHLLGSDLSRVDDTVEELLRYLSIVQYSVTRTAVSDVELPDGRIIREGESVTVSLPAANRDPSRFENPDRLDLTRSAAGHLAFGHGVHQCVGQQLARLEMRVGFEALIKRFPALELAVPPGEVPLGNDLSIYGVNRLPVRW
jgi:cytochrome P450